MGVGSLVSDRYLSTLVKKGAETFGRCVVTMYSQIAILTYALGHRETEISR